jgi:hypothetical protein
MKPDVLSDYYHFLVRHNRIYGRSIGIFPMSFANALITIAKTVPFDRKETDT